MGAAPRRGSDSDRGGAVGRGQVSGWDGQRGDGRVVASWLVRKVGRQSVLPRIFCVPMIGTRLGIIGTLPLQHASQLSIGKRL